MSRPEHGLGQMTYTRQDLMGWWHKAARELSPADLSWENRDHLRGRCTIILSDGEVTKPEEPYSKQALIDEFGLQPRDLRALDAHILDVRPSLLVCKRSILLCTPICRAVISHDRIVLFGDDPTRLPLCSEEEQDELVEAIIEISDHLDVIARSTLGEGPAGKAPFEFRALESLLLLTVRGFKIVSSNLEARVHKIIPQLRFGVSPAELKELLESKRTIEDCLYSGRALQTAVSAVLGEDEDLVGMYLTDKFNKIPRDVEDHQTAELLLEYYERRLDESNEAAVRMSSLLSDIDSNISLVLASTRVKLQNLELQTAITTLALGAGTALAGFFGMNLVSGYENHPVAFYYAVGAGVGSMAAIMLIGWARLVRARRSQLFLGNSLREREHHRMSAIRASKRRERRLERLGCDAVAAKEANEEPLGTKKNGTEM
ncbi:hypothetical protein T439DRAFT_324421 [Meredithblackwellia eburnea MCA 4105]